MENKTLDEILTLLLEKYKGDFNHEVSFRQTHYKDFSDKEWDDVSDFLVQQQYVRRDHRLYGERYFTITPQGIMFIKDGGFTSEASYKKETLQVAKESKHYAKWAFIVSIISIAVALLLFGIER